MERVVATIFDITIAKRSPFCIRFMESLKIARRSTEIARRSILDKRKIGEAPLAGSSNIWLEAPIFNAFLIFITMKRFRWGKVDFVAIRFTPEKMFQIDDRVYREAVEGLVQQKLLNWVDEQKLEITIVSQTRENSYSKLPGIQEEAARISSDLEPWILECYQINE